ncbi:THAP domain containing 9 [Plakobranchus ocellatus]|uniref:THAP domain containing 9 n=1 Tax=Plakobranchus ocellatus TaxID=259542 RepID=A0AAV4DTI3_9GAST|nr:THAP domain containing 9 [Plakobranchus ocellatus]
MKADVELGCNMDVYNLCTHFQHQHARHSDEKVYSICDPPHMLMLFRKFLVKRGLIKWETEHGMQTILWQYIKSLHELQNTESQYLANKLTNKHINFKNSKMKVNIATQTLSSSVATAIGCLRDYLKLPQFQGSEKTCFFICQVDKLLDICNSKNPFAKGFKAALGESKKGSGSHSSKLCKYMCCRFKKRRICLSIKDEQISVRWDSSSQHSPHLILPQICYQGKATDTCLPTNSLKIMKRYILARFVNK